VISAADAEEALRLLKDHPIEFVLTDYKLPGKSGIELVKAIRESKSPAVTAVMTAHASFENAVNAIKEGAYDYIAKPFSNAQLEHLLTKVSDLVELRRENDRLRSGSYRQEYFEGLTSPAIARLEEFVRKVSPSEASILLTGESGTGKSELAKLIHAKSARAPRAFVTVNCTTLSENLIESELFGHVKGAFTGAVSDHVGKLEYANHGTLFIDEVGELSPNGQTKLLRFLQEKVIERVGGNKSITLDVRVIAATNRNLEEAVKDGSFREDLYYRLNMFECSLVPIRYRKEDLPVLIQRFLKEFLVKSGTNSLKEIPKNVLDPLLKYNWPGNIRELKNTIERIVLLSSGREFSLDDLPDAVLKGDSKPTSQETVYRSLDDVEREHIARVLSVENNQERAAEILGITTVTLWRKRKQFGLP
jgi:NtrC-family two-component system response regulator AlgB